MAPEVYRRESYGKSVDVFSFALIVHEVTISKIYFIIIFFVIWYVKKNYSFVIMLFQMFQGGPSNLAEDAEQIADRRAYEDSRPPLSSFLYPEPIKT